MIDISFHIYYNNNSLSSAWPLRLPAVPRVGESIEYNPSHSDTEVWTVVEVGYKVYEGTEGQPYVFARPSWAPEVHGGSE